MKLSTLRGAAIAVVLLSHRVGLAQSKQGFPPAPAQAAPQGGAAPPATEPAPVSPTPQPSPDGAPPASAPPPGWYTPPPGASPPQQYPQPQPQPQYGHPYPAYPPAAPYAPPPAAPYAPPPAAEVGVSAEAAAGPGSGPYFGAWLGSGGPFGGLMTSDDNPPQVSQGLGFLAAAGYAFIPNFGANLFLHYNVTERLFPEDVNVELDENSGSVLLYGIEGRGTIGSGPLAAWASLGLALGSGSMDLTATSPGGGSDGRSTVQYDLDWKVMPVLAFGAEVELVSGLSVGPHARWYITSADKACEEARVSFAGDEFTSKDCTEDFDAVTVPDIVFLGLGATYRLDLGG